MEKKKVLWLSDFACSTGFAQVAHNIIDHLQSTGLYEFDVIGINHRGEPYDFKRWPFPIYPAVKIDKITDPRYADPFGRQRMLDMLGTGDYDILFTLQDSFVMEEVARQIVETKKALIKNGKKAFQWIFYYPIDSEAKSNWITDSASLADIPVTYTEFAKSVTQKFMPGLNVEVINHGTDISVFFPLDPKEVQQFRKDYFEGHADGKFVVTNLNRNQRRKDVPRTIAAFAKFHEKHSDSLLYLHMRRHDVGGDVYEMARHFGLEPGIDVIAPKGFNENVGYPLEIVNYIYNASDVVISTTLGEGWGLSSTEAMAAKTPVIFPNNTSLVEILAEGRGRLVDCGVNDNDFICLGAEDMNQFRPLTDIEDLVLALEDAKAGVFHTDQVENAYKWVLERTWKAISKQWEEVFASVQESKPVVKHSPNLPCPECAKQGIQKKWKKCKVHNPQLDLIS